MKCNSRPLHFLCAYLTLELGSWLCSATSNPKIQWAIRGSHSSVLIFMLIWSLSGHHPCLLAATLATLPVASFAIYCRQAVGNLSDSDTGNRMRSLIACMRHCLKIPAYMRREPWNIFGISQRPRQRRGRNRIYQYEFKLGKMNFW